MDVAGRDLVRDDTCARPFEQQEIDDEEFAEELHALLVALLVEGLKDHVTGAIGGVTSPANRRLPVVAGMATEATLVDLAVVGPVERKSHALEIDDRVDGFLAHDVDGVLVGEEIAALDGVEG